MAGVEGAAVAVLGAAREEGGGGDEAGGVVEAVVLVAVSEVGDEAEHGVRAVALAEPAVEAWGGDDAAPAPAHDRGAEEAHGVAWRQAEEDLLNVLLRQRLLHPAWLAGLRRAAADGGRRGIAGRTRGSLGEFPLDKVERWLC